MGERSRIGFLKVVFLTFPFPFIILSLVTASR